MVLAFAAANSDVIFRRRDILACGVDVNKGACKATCRTVHTALRDRRESTATAQKSGPTYLGSLAADLCTAFRPGSIDILLFNPPYVPTPETPALPSAAQSDHEGMKGIAATAGAGTATGGQLLSRSEKFEQDSYLLSLTYAGGVDGMETTNRFLDAVAGGILEPCRGVAYLLLCAQNHPTEVQDRIRQWGDGWQAEIVGRSGMQAGWERLVIVRIWREVEAQNLK